MTTGAHVFGPNRVGIWAVENANLTDKLKHVLPRAKALIPNLTDIFLPLSASTAARDVVRQNNFFAHLYCVAHDTDAVTLAKLAKAARLRLGTGAIEVDLEGAAVQPDKPALASYQRRFVGEIRRTNPNLPLRLNVPPYKGYALDIGQLIDDPQLFVIAQAYYGNMDGRLSESDVMLDLLDFAVPRAKAKIQYAVMTGEPDDRQFVLPGADYKPITEGSVYDDDLLIESGRLSA
jgi:hypothetical protein